ncbi:MAG: hypothetical protein KC493_13920 [Bacteriovoracaceae bacterium]|nr:hypothetical protein [Bacteriovoracaceae bacterium]
MSDGMMQQLIDKIRKQHPTLTNKRGESEGYVYVVKNQETLIAVERTTSHKDDALIGGVTDIKHEKSGIAMMSSAYNRLRNNIYYIPTTKKKGAEIERELKQIEKSIKGIVQNHYDISDKNAGDTYCSGTTNNKDAANILKKFLSENLSPETLKELNEPNFSFMELLAIVDEDGDAWSKLIKNQKSAQLACKFLGVIQSP